MKCVDTIARIRREFFVRGRTIKEIVRDLHVSRNTVPSPGERVNELVTSSYKICLSRDHGETTRQIRPIYERGAASPFDETAPRRLLRECVA